MKEVLDMNEDINEFISEIKEKKFVFMINSDEENGLHFVVFYFFFCFVLLTLFDVRRKNEGKEDRHISIQTRPSTESTKRKKSTTCLLFFLSLSTHSRPLSTDTVDE
jgi:hypothetical protein